MRAMLGGMMLAVAAWAPAAAQRQIAVSANDGKAVPADAPDTPRTADTITILDMTGSPRALASIPVPATLTGPPASVALTRDARTAIVTAGQVLGADGKPGPGDAVTVVDLHQPAAPRIVQRLHAGTGAAGIAISPDGRLALIANTGADSVSVFRIVAGQLQPAGAVTLPPRSRPVDLSFADAASAYVVAQGMNRLIRLAIAGTAVTADPDAIATGPGPYSLALNRRTRMAYVSQLGGRTPSAVPGPKAGAIGIIDLARGRMTGQIDTGVTPEHVALSPSGRYLQVTVNNGSTLPATSPAFRAFGTMVIHRVKGDRLIPVAEARTGQWCQGAAWRADERRILLQCSLDKRIEVWRFDGRRLSPDTPIPLDARPGAIATEGSR